MRTAATAFAFSVMAAVSAQPPAESKPDTAPAAAEPDPDLPDYSGTWRERDYLSGDWGGNRTALAAKGLTLDLRWTQITQGVVAGGRRIDWDYGGNLDLAVNADLERMSLIPGGSVVLRVESRYGETVNDDTGTFTPVNTRGYFPLTDPINEGLPIVITELAYTQSFSDKLEFTIGKMLVAAGDPVEFALGLGATQFLNSNFFYNAVTSQTAPYSTLGAAVDWSPTEHLTLSSALFATTDSSTTSGFEHLDDGWTWWMQAAAQYRLGTLPGGVDAGAQYAFGNDFARIGGKLTLIPGGVALETVSDSWAVFFGAWQYLYAPDAPEDQIDASDDHADLKGVGLFARFGFADPDANPVNWSASAGLGGRGLLPGRDHDTFGAGYYYTDIQNARAFSALGLSSSAQGLEAYYSLAITPALNLTLDIQWLSGGFTSLDPATVVGVRLNADF